MSTVLAIPFFTTCPKVYLFTTKTHILLHPSMAFSIPRFTQPPATRFLQLPHRNPSHVVFAFRVQRSRIISIACVLAFLVLMYSIWPSCPDLKISRMRLNYLKLCPAPGLLIDLSLRLTIKVHNHDMYSMDYRIVDVAIGYRGEVLGHVRSEDGHLRPLGTSYVNADVDIDGTRVWSDVVPLLEDLLRGSIQLDTVTSVEGRLGVLFFDFPVKAKISCELIVNTRNRTVASHSCRAG